jgi:hypothetical protein
VKDSFYEELEGVFDKFPKYDMNRLFGYLSSKGSRENFFKPTIGNARLHEISNDNGGRVVTLPREKI